MPSLDQLRAFFFNLAEIKHLHDQDLDAAFERVRNRDFRKAWRKVLRRSRSVEDLLAFQYAHVEAIRLLIGRDLYPVMAAAAHLTQLPPLPPGATVLDVGGGPGHLALWMLECWPLSTITVLDRVASAVNRDWTPGLAASNIRFVDGDVPADLAAVQGLRFDRIIIARTLAQEASSDQDLRPIFREALVALRGLVVDGGDVIVIDHFHGRDSEMADAINSIAQEVGFDRNIRGWHAPEPELPWQLRLVASRRHLIEV